MILTMEVCENCGRGLIPKVRHYCSHTKRYNTRNAKRTEQSRINAVRSHVRNIDHERLGICPLCQRAKLLVKDHDHISGRKRSKICSSCNTGLGLFLDDPDLLNRAAEYLKYWKTKDILGL